MARDEGRISYHYIPKNFANGINLLGFNFKTRNLLEGILIGLIAAAGMFLILMLMPGFDIGTTIGSCAAVLIAGVIAGCLGLNDEPISEYFMNYMKYKKRKRTAFYNPRVKLESVSYKELKLKQDEKKLENRLKSKFSKAKDKYDEKLQDKVQTDQTNNYFDAEKMFFKDDEGIIKKPKEYMSDKELEAHEKEQAQREKNILKFAKQIEREERYKE